VFVKASWRLSGLVFAEKIQTADASPSSGDEAAVWWIKVR